MSPYSLKKRWRVTYLLSQRVDSILNVADATNLERNLYLTTQLIETGIPVTLALNMMMFMRLRENRLMLKNYLII